MAELVTGEAVALDIRVARLASRGCALLLDLMFQLILLNVAVYVTGLTALVADEAWTIGLSLVAVVAVMVGYPCAFETLSRGRTLGKMALRIRVVADDGGPIRFRQALVRALAGFIEFWTLYGAPALITSFCNRRGKRLGDLFAGTIVIQERIPSSGLFGPVAVMPPQLAWWARSLEISMLSDELAMTARQYLSRFWELLPEVRDSLGQRIAAQVVAAISPPPPPGVRPEILLSAVLAERRHREEWRLAQRRARRLRRSGRTDWAQPPAPGAVPIPVPAMATAGAGQPPPPGWQGPPAGPPWRPGPYPTGPYPTGAYPAAPYPTGSYPYPAQGVPPSAYPNNGVQPGR
ncbi:RDD family protein [Actinomadura sp. LD22]|uniref:RDD family protein n=1 Tax=Actinomadura physcomitrii TaxID=2650748 RepID=A0A6I4MN39_9ACTN|nr:RDD family protein [Actinomadura physcomitrii]MVZ98956.1 RDD family protein [Actinomadura physcomitrii]MWA05534.1 RDD family protein [Actinomadura physcomitrii]